MRVWKGRVLLLATLLVLPAAGCGGSMQTTRGVLQSADIAIVGPDFKLESGHPFEVPFILDTWKQGASDDLPNAYKKWEKKGAERVKVYVPGHTEPLFGVMSFHAIPSSSTGPGTRSFSVRVDPSYIEQASDGRVSVVYELVPQKSGTHAYGWVLWMSDREF
jgi:hypothetical protein